MAKKKRKNGTEKLTREEIEYLCWGYSVGGHYFGEPEPFESKDQAAAAWRNHAAAVREAFKGDFQDSEYSEPWAAREFEGPAG